MQKMWGNLKKGISESPYLYGSEIPRDYKYPGEDRADTWDKRKKESLAVLKNSTDIGVKMLWLADKLANIRSLARAYSEQGEKVWKTMNQKSPAKQRWYYRTIAEYLELELNKTGAYKELIRQINAIWPGTFASEKEKYKNYRTVSVDGCRKIGRGAKGDAKKESDILMQKTAELLEHVDTLSF